MSLFFTISSYVQSVAEFFVCWEGAEVWECEADILWALQASSSLSVCLQADTCRRGVWAEWEKSSDTHHPQTVPSDTLSDSCQWLYHFHCFPQLTFKGTTVHTEGTTVRVTSSHCGTSSFLCISMICSAFSWILKPCWSFLLGHKEAAAGQGALLLCLLFSPQLRKYCPCTQIHHQRCLPASVYRSAQIPGHKH